MSIFERYMRYILIDRDVLELMEVKKKWYSVYWYAQVQASICYPLTATVQDFGCSDIPADYFKKEDPVVGFLVQF